MLGDMTGLLDFVAAQEGYSPRPYWDHRQWTSGYGTKASGPGEMVDREEAQRRLAAEIEKARGYVTQRWQGLAPNQADALASFTYNLGPGWMQGSSLAQALDAGDWQGAAARMRQYINAGGKPLPGLVRRRGAEAAMFLGGSIPPASADGNGAGEGFLGSSPMAEGGPAAGYLGTSADGPRMQPFQVPEIKVSSPVPQTAAPMPMMPRVRLRDYA